MVRPMTADSILDSQVVPTGRVLTQGLRHLVEGDHEGSTLVRFTMATQHFTSQLPRNETVSSRLNLEWMVISEDTGDLLGVISQGNHSYRHPEIILSLPRDRNLVLVPSAPYLSVASSAVQSIALPLGLGEPAYRYEFEVGSASDAGFIGPQWSYREGHMPFGDWFHNKAFRWGLDGATLRLPTVAGAAMWININMICGTTIDVWSGGVRVATFNKGADIARWHDDAYGFAIPADLVTSDTIEVAFRLANPEHWMLDFSLRRTPFALSRVTVDVLGKDASDLPARLTASAWKEEAGAAPAIASDMLLPGAAVAQAALLISPVEFQLIRRHFAPHSNFWLTVRGLARGFLASGVTMSVLPADADPAALGRYESVVLGPLRFDEGLGRRLQGAGHISAAAMTFTTGSLEATGTPVNDQLLGVFTYQDLFDVTLPAGENGNFWEILPTQAGFWARNDLVLGGYTVVGRPAASPWTLLAASSPADWMEMGDDFALKIIDHFASVVSTPRTVTAAGQTCGLLVEGDELIVIWPERRTALRSFGGGIARGWPALESDVPLFDEHRAAVRLGSELPAQGDVALAIRKTASLVDGAEVVSGSSARFSIAPGHDTVPA